jgi:hypothetical protein
MREVMARMPATGQILPHFAVNTGAIPLLGRNLLSRMSESAAAGVGRRPFGREGWMQSAHQTPLGAARATRPDLASKLAYMLTAAIVGPGLVACAGPSPQVQVAAADASQPATADSDTAGRAATSESAAATTTESKPGSTDTTESGNASPPVETTDNSAPPVEPQGTTGTTAGSAPTPPATDAPQTAAAQQPEQSAAASGAHAGDVPPPGAGLATGRPYVVIRFTESSVDYEKALAEAVKRAVARKPNLAFDLVAVTPRAGTADELAGLTEKAHAEAAAVMKSLSALGIGPERVSIMTWTGQPTDVNEIRLYIR